MRNEDNKWIIVAVIVIVLLVGNRAVFAVKPGAILSNEERIEYARRVVARVWQKYGYQVTVTSGYDGTHSARSKHYEGLAEDYRIRDVAPSHLPKMIAEVKAILGSDYDVVLESDHLHIEFDPK